MMSEINEPVFADVEYDLSALRPKVYLYVDKVTNRWIVLDRDGQYWILPPDANSWENRQPYEPGKDSELESVPSHYLYMLGLKL